MASLQERVIGVLQLNAATFEEVEADANATSQAAIVVVAAALSGAIGGLRSGSVMIAAFGAVMALIGWGIGSFVILMVGTKILPGKNTQADLGQMLRTLGFAQAPGLFGILRIIPVLGLLIGLVISIWGLVAAIIGVKAGLDYDDYIKPIIVCVIAWVIMFVLLLIPGLMLGTAMVLGGAGR